MIYQPLCLVGIIGVKTVQTMLAAKKTGNTSKENPPKRDKRTHSDVAEDSVEGIDIMSIHSDLGEIKKIPSGYLYQD